MKINLIFKGKQLISSQMQFWDPNLLVGINYSWYDTPFYTPTCLTVLKIPGIMCLNVFRVGVEKGPYKLTVQKKKKKEREKSLSTTLQNEYWVIINLQNIIHLLKIFISLLSLTIGHAKYSFWLFSFNVLRVGNWVWTQEYIKLQNWYVYLLIILFQLGSLTISHTKSSLKPFFLP